MRLRTIAFVAGFTLELIASVLLVIRTGGSPEIDIPESEVAKARATYRRRQAATKTPAPQPTPTPPSRTRRPDPEPEPEPDTERKRLPRRSAQPSRNPPSLPEAEKLEEQKPSGPELSDVRSAYDRGRYMDAVENARAFLEEEPDNAYVRRVLVSSACATGKVDVAREYYEKMSDLDKKTSRKRCGKYGIEL